MTNTLTGNLVMNAEPLTTKLVETREELSVNLVFWTESEFSSLPKTDETNDFISVSNACRKMIHAEGASERIDAARQVIDIRPNLGLPYAVLALNNGCSEVEKAELYSKSIHLLMHEYAIQKKVFQALRHSKGSENQSRVIAPYLIIDDGISIISFWTARALWQVGQPVHASNILKDAIELLDGDEDSSLCSLAVSYLTQQNLDDEASALLRDHSNEIPEWYCLNALLLYRRHGNSPLSRASLREAMKEDVNFAEKIFHKESTELATFDLDYVDSTPWFTTPGAIQWLTDFLRDYSPETLTDLPDQSGALERDKMHFKLWKDRYEIAAKHLSRENYKDAKREAKAALKESLKLSPESSAVVLSFEQLREISLKFDDSLDYLLPAIEGHLNNFRPQVFDKLKLARRLTTTSGFFVSSDKYDRAISLLTEALQTFESELVENNSNVELSEIADLQFALGFCFGGQRNFEQAAAHLKRNLDIRAEFLGANHPSNSDSLRFLFCCLHFIGKHDEESAVKKRLEVIDPAWLAHDEYSPYKDGVWKIPKCEDSAS